MVSCARVHNLEFRNSVLLTDREKREHNADSNMRGSTSCQHCHPVSFEMQNMFQDLFDVCASKNQIILTRSAKNENSVIGFFTFMSLQTHKILIHLQNTMKAKYGKQKLSHTRMTYEKQ